MSHHTPGTWIAEPIANSGDFRIFDGNEASPGYIATVHRRVYPNGRPYHASDVETQANALLIAQAPALLAERNRLRAALEGAVQVAEAALSCVKGSWDSSTERKMTEARAALSANPPAAPSEAEQVNGELSLVEYLECIDPRHLASDAVRHAIEQALRLARAAQAKGGK